MCFINKKKPPNEKQEEKEEFVNLDYYDYITSGSAVVQEFAGDDEVEEDSGFDLSELGLIAEEIILEETAED